MGRGTTFRTRPRRRFPVRSAIAVAALVGVLLGFLVFLGSVGILDLRFIVNNWNSLYGPAWISLSLTIASFLLGFAIAMPLGLIRAYGLGILRRRERPENLSYRRAKEVFDRSRALRVVLGLRVRRLAVAPAYGAATGYVEAIRGTPFFVQTWLVFYFAVSALSGLGSQVYYTAGLLALTINTIGYQAEVLRAGFQSVGQAQIDAAKAIGMRSRQIFARITLPQSLRLVILPLTNEWISLFKASAILSFIAVQDLMFQSKNLGSNLGHPLEAFVMVAAMYLIINIPLSKVVTYVERRRRIPGLGALPLEIRAARAGLARGG